MLRSLRPLQLHQESGRHSVGVWIGGVWNGQFPESENIFQRPNFPGESLKFRRKSDFAKFQAPKFENSEPEKTTSRNSIPIQPFHTPTRLTPENPSHFQCKILRPICGTKIHVILKPDGRMCISANWSSQGSLQCLLGHLFCTSRGLGVLAWNCLEKPWSHCDCRNGLQCHRIQWQVHLVGPAEWPKSGVLSGGSGIILLI